MASGDGSWFCRLFLRVARNKEEDEDGNVDDDGDVAIATLNIYILKLKFICAEMG